MVTADDPTDRNESSRLNALRACGVLDSAQDPDYDRLTRLATTLFKTSMAVITLIDEQRQWFKSRVGIAQQQTSRAVAFCDHTLRSPGIFEVEDAAADARFRHNPLVVGNPHIRFYAGAPLYSKDGYALGALALLDEQPRRLTEEQRQMLRLLADQAERLLELGRERELHRATAEQLNQAEQLGEMGSWRFDLNAGRIHWSDAVYRILKRSREEFDGRFERYLEWVPEADRPALHETLSRVQQTGDVVEVQHRMALPGGELRHLQLRGRHLRSGIILGVVRDVTEDVESRSRLQTQLARIEQVHAALDYHLHNAPIAVIEWDGELRVTGWSRQAESLLGWTADEVLGKRPEDWPLIHPEDEEEVLRIVAELRSGARRRIISANRNLTRDGRVLHCQWINSMQHDAEGRPISLLSLVLDRTVQVEAEQAALAALHEEQSARIGAERERQRLIHLFESLPEHLLVVSAADFTTRLLTRSAAQRFQDAGAGALQRPVSELLVHLGWHAAQIEELTRLLASVRETRVADAAVIEPGDDQPRWLAWVSPVVDAAGPVSELLIRLDEQGWDREESGDTAELRRHAVALERLNAQIRESESRHRRLLDDAAMAIVSLDTDGHILSANPVFRDLLQVDEPSLRGRRLMAWLSVEDAATLAQGLARLARGESRSELIEYRLPAKDGAERWVRGSFALHQDAEGQGAHYTMVAIEITRERLAQSALRESQWLYSLAGRLGRIGGWVAELDTHRVHWSQEIYQMLGWDPASTPALESVMAHYPPESRARINQCLDACTERGEAFDIEVDIDACDGRRLQVRVAAEAERAADGRVIRLLGAFQDVTELRRVQREHERFSVRLREMLENMSDGFYLLDRQGRFAYLNPVAQRILQTEEQRVLLGQSIWECFPETAHAPLGRLLKQAREHHQSDADTYFDERLQEWLAVNVHPSSEGTAVYFRVVTAQKQMEAKLQQSQRLEAVGQLTGGIAHDFNNLLTVMLGNAELLTEQLPAGERLHALADMIHAAARRGAELTQHLLAFARRQPLQPQTVDVNRLVADMDGLLRRSIGEHIEIELVQGAGLWLAQVDPTQLESALLNLALNARDAMPGGGRLTIETANGHIDADYAARHTDLSPGQYVMLGVSDTGAGIAPEYLPRVFEPFFSTKPRGAGSGLGLSMVFGFVKQSGGHVAIYSEPGQGTTVKLYLPRRIAPGATAADDRRLPGSAIGGQEKILLVEDDALVRRYVREQLLTLGYAVIEAADGAAALQQLAAAPDIDLLFTDVVMPGGMSGRQLADLARQQRTDLRVLFTSGYTENAIVHHGRLDPGVDLLSKPYRRSQLARKLREVLDR
jgi:PAS domain S-box-containing protein